MVPGRSQQECEYRVRHRAGHYVDVWDRSVVLRDETGRPVRLVGCTLDVSERRRTEEALRESEERHRVISDLTYDYNYAMRIAPEVASNSSWSRKGSRR